jgi:RNA polymerase sigma factor (sigma-70 family)
VNQLRELAPQVLGVLVRRYGDFAGAEDAVQEALIAAVSRWPKEGEPADPKAWLIRVASRRLANQYRAESARRRREDLAASWSIHSPPDPAPSTDDTLLVMLMCCHPSLTPGAAIPLTLRAVGGLTTREIAAAFLIPEPTMAQRISRAKAKIKEAAPLPMASGGSAEGESLQSPQSPQSPQSLQSVLRVLYLIFNEGYEASAGPDLGRPDLAAEAIRLTHMLVESTGDREAEGLLALMLLSESRRPARTSPEGALVPLAEQDRSKWDRGLINEGLVHVTSALRQGPLGEYGLQAAVQGLHAEAPSHEATRWADIAELYDRLERLTANPVVRLNRAVAVAMLEGPAAGLALIEDLESTLGEHHRLVSVRAHLQEMAGHRDQAVDGFLFAARRTLNTRERDYLLTQAARVTTHGCRVRCSLTSGE